MRLPALLVEAFAAGPCEGNGAAVVLLEKGLADDLLQAVARSLNQSETAFLTPIATGWGLRWFTPTCEVPLCGHATLAALLALGHWGLLQPGSQTSMQTRAGELPVTLLAGGVAGAGCPQGSIELPCGQLESAICPPYLAGLLDVELGAAVGKFWRSSLGYAVALLEPEAPLAQAAGLAEILAGAMAAEERQGLVLMQALAAMVAAPGPSVAGIDASYQLRFFAPGLGIQEDPVTGSAHGLVAPYWLGLLGVNEVCGWQCSPRPGGMLLSQVAPGWMRLRGSGHVLWDGSLQLPLGELT